MANKSENSKRVDLMNVDDAIDLIAKDRGVSREDAVEYAVRQQAKRILAVNSAPAKITPAKIAAAEKALEKQAARIATQQAKLDAMKAAKAARTESSDPAPESSEKTPDAPAATGKKPPKR